MPRILGKRVPGSPGWRTRGLIPSLGGGAVTRDSARKSGIRRLFARDPSKGAFVNIGTDKDVLGTIVPAKNATLVTAMAGANNDIKYTGKPAGTVGNSIRVAHVVAGASTPLSIGVSGNDITVNVQTNGASAAISTADQVIAAIKASAAASAKLEAERAPGNDGTGVVAAFALTNLTGGAQAVGQHEDVPGEAGGPNPTIVDGSGIRRRSVPAGQIGVANRSANRRIRRR